LSLLADFNSRGIHFAWSVLVHQVRCFERGGSTLSCACNESIIMHAGISKSIFLFNAFRILRSSKNYQCFTHCQKIFMLNIIYEENIATSQLASQYLMNTFLLMCE
jgi:hypothetical protein